MAQAMGAKAIWVDDPNGIAPALADAQRANADGEVVVIEIATMQYTHFSQYPELLS